MCSSYTVGVTTPLERTDKLRNGDYVYEINKDSILPFERVLLVKNVNPNGDIDLIDICSGKKIKINVKKDDLTNYQKLQLTDYVRRLLGIQP